VNAIALAGLLGGDVATVFVASHEKQTTDSNVNMGNMNSY
jgi:hypothetical protein